MPAKAVQGSDGKWYEVLPGGKRGAEVPPPEGAAPAATTTATEDIDAVEAETKGDAEPPPAEAPAAGSKGFDVKAFTQKIAGGSALDVSAAANQISSGSDSDVKAALEALGSALDQAGLFKTKKAEWTPQQKQIADRLSGAFSRLQQEATKRRQAGAQAVGMSR